MASALQRLIAVIAASGAITGELLKELRSVEGIEKAQQDELDQARTDIADLKARVTTLESNTGDSALETRVAALESAAAADKSTEEASFPIVITPLTLPAATVGTPFSQQLTAADGVAPYEFTATGLPADLTLSTDGLLSGTPSVAETASIVVTATDADGDTGSVTYDYTAS